MGLYNKLTGLSFVYDNIRPLIVGGVDNSPGYELLEAGIDDVVVDVGCGTGDALRHLRSFRAYYGFDIDAKAIETARRRAAQLGVDARFEARQLKRDDLARLQPTRVMLAGLLHHLPDGPALELLSMLARTPSVRRIATIDIVYLKGEYVSNALAFLDRGRDCRRIEQYIDLAQRAGLRVAGQRLVRCHPTKGRAKYLDLALEPVCGVEQTPFRALEYSGGMKNEKEIGYKTRDTIMKLLSDDEIARVSTAEEANHLSDGDEYLDLEHLDLGVLKAKGKSTPMGRVLSKKAVREETWKTILAKLPRTA